MKIARSKCVALVVLLAACSDITAKLPAGSVNPEYYKTPEAAYEMAQNVRYEFQYNLLDYMLESGMFADEFFDNRNSAKVVGNYDKLIILDQRYTPDDGAVNSQLATMFNEITSYSKLQRVRAIASLANRALAMHDIESYPRLRAEMLVYEALSTVMLAELYCSGIPLSTVDFEGDYSYSGGLSTEQVYRKSELLIDTAISLVNSNDSIAFLSYLAKGRILLASGRYEEAEQLVKNIPDGFSFTLPRLRLPVQSSTLPRGMSWATLMSNKSDIANRKGTNGMPYIEGNDPRIRKTVKSTGYSRPSYVPAELLNLTIVTYLEARLIEAEADLATEGSRWLNILNDLRATVPGLIPLEDPALSPLPSGKSERDVRIDLLFSERAFWLFFSGRRQGDMRRLVRNYNRDIESVYPMGDYPSGSGSYEPYMDIPIPPSERFNPEHAGCSERGR